MNMSSRSGIVTLLLPSIAALVLTAPAAADTLPKITRADLGSSGDWNKFFCPNP